MIVNNQPADIIIIYILYIYNNIFYYYYYSNINYYKICYLCIDNNKIVNFYYDLLTFSLGVADTGHAGSPLIIPPCPSKMRPDERRH